MVGWGWKGPAGNRGSTEGWDTVLDHFPTPHPNTQNHREHRVGAREWGAEGTAFPPVLGALENQAEGVYPKGMKEEVQPAAGGGEREVLAQERPACQALASLG